VPPATIARVRDTVARTLAAKAVDNAIMPPTVAAVAGLCARHVQGSLKPTAKRGPSL
jgi:hypothetical protein